ncbi:ALP1-like protein [Tanacetum coccineum]|uniref:ALP1-like protein n=1 Tax=Tanacetum coccineum TaxID=301880 RepID=A0ABQ4ZGC4_9ASTR
MEVSTLVSQICQKWSFFSLIFLSLRVLISYLLVLAGLNCEEAVRFIQADWLPYGGYDAEFYQHYRKAYELSTISLPTRSMRDDCMGHRGISSLMKCTSIILQMAYESVPDSLDKNLQMGVTTASKCLKNFCKVIMNLYGDKFLRKPTYTDMEKLYAYHNEKHGFPGMLGSINCTHWPWANYLVAFRAQFSRGDQGADPFILLEAIASDDIK